MNYSAEQIKHVYTQVINEKNNVLSKLTIVKVGKAFGNYQIDVDDAFNYDGDDDLKYEKVGYGGVQFMGNINGKVPTQGLFYKTPEYKKQIENFIIVNDLIEQDKTENVAYIIEQHGNPKPECSMIMFSIKKGK